MTRRQGVIAALSAVCAWLIPTAKPQVRAGDILKTQDNAGNGEVAGPYSLGSTKSALLLYLDNMAEDAFTVSYQGEEIKLTAKEIMAALKEGR